MKKILHIALRTGFSFREVFQHPHRVFEYAVDGVVGCADMGNTFCHHELDLLMKEDEKKKALYGVRLTVVRDATERDKDTRGQCGPEYIFIARNLVGLREIYNLVKINSENFYYRSNISWHDMKNVSDNVITIAEYVEDDDHLKYIDYIGLSPTTPRMMKQISKEHKIPLVAVVNNYFPTVQDFPTYELLVGPRNSDHKTYPQHVLSTEEWFAYMLKRGFSEKELEKAIDNTYKVAESCEKMRLPKAPLIKAKTGGSIEYLCKLGAQKKKINIISGPYADRYNYEIKLIKERKFDDYFIVVADIIAKAKKKMLVGPGRGSSGGSLVCYLLGITEFDPIENDLLFERFIDINRNELPDIDVDFPDESRDSVIKQIVADYGEDHVKHIANLSRLQAKSAIGNFCKGLLIPISETEALKNSIIERSGGDSRAAQCIEDTFNTTEVGKEFIRKFPAMATVAAVEDHPDHSSTHAAGIIICNDPVHHYAGVNLRDNTVMLDKVGAEHQNLLKIDILGLRTLSVLTECAKMIGMNHKDFYSLPLNDEATFDIFNSGRINGVFQFEGHSLMGLTKRMGVHKFEDIVAITALARPGALYSGGAARYVKYRIGEDKPVYYGELHKRVTEKTYGIVVFQEQILMICREIGKMSWTDVNQLRKALSKSLGEEFFSKYKEKFMTGAKENGYTEDEGDFIWNEVCYGGNYAFNRSHAVAYGLISYWTAYMKANHPLEFVVASLRNEKDTESSIKILRDAVENEGIEYVPIDPDHSVVEWSVSKGRIVGGLTNIKGIGVAKAKQIMECRAGKAKWTKSLVNMLLNPVTDFDELWPCRAYFHDIYENPRYYELPHKCSFIKDVSGTGSFVFIGKLKFKNIRDLNEYVNLQKRGGEVLTSNSLELAIKLEDDTDSIMASVSRFDFEEIGRDIAENGIVDEDWFIVHGKIKGENSRYVHIKEITKIDPKDFKDKHSGIKK
jgi:DNA polymerase III alpha subunit